MTHVNLSLLHLDHKSTTAIARDENDLVFQVGVVAIIGIADVDDSAHKITARGQAGRQCQVGGKVIAVTGTEGCPVAAADQGIACGDV